MAKLCVPIVIDWDDIKDHVAKFEKHGQWVKDPQNGPYSLYKCSACNEFCTGAGWANCIPEEQMYKGFKYCPNCGARMDMN